MTAWDVFALQPRVARVITSAVRRDRLPPAYLFHGREGTGKWAAAMRTAQLLSCPDAAGDEHDDCRLCRRIAEYNFPDVHWILPRSARSGAKGGSRSTAQSTPGIERDEETDRLLQIKRSDLWAPLEYARRPYMVMAQVRALQATLNRTPAEGPRKVGILINTEHMRQDAQSVLLKTIEEPPPNTHLILTTTERSALLPTILSRCQAVHFLPLPTEAIVKRLGEERQVEEDRARQIAERSGGSWQLAQRLADVETDGWRQRAEALWRTVLGGSTDQLIRSVDEIFSGRPRMDEILYLLDTLQAQLSRTSIALATAVNGTTDADTAIVIPLLFKSRALLADARQAIVGNVTPKTALAAVLLTIRSTLAGKGETLVHYSAPGITG